MFARLKTWWRNRKQPKVWIMQDDHGIWHKMITYSKPYNVWSWAVQGPFRSEVDAEETCDHLNQVACKQRVGLYRTTEIEED